ncbi:hypothetical protein RhiirA5_451021 [Rhizophagus irregularis]|uniref:Ricin B lectin domain-containing protein n=1 Tax=Rhizophagus irregularis TaxID=588596 RepID=A0A2N0R292_9GLOM|nr:hypothetical protein RhiirA5_451021 [Rhizophagus irregularis]PKC57429.1 hypothetical protein RhiirA1_79063 [Rhizophagus irregularis]CAB4481436.1 unnamed protein product [Rhizophagus irregularis]
MKFNLFLLLIATLLVVGSSQQNFYNIQDFTTKKYWAITKTPKAPQVGLVTNKGQAETWKITTAADGKSYISPYSDIKLLVTYKKDGEPLALESTTGKASEWKLVNTHTSDLVAIQSFANPNDYANVGGFFGNLVVSSANNQDTHWKLEQIHLKRVTK